MQLSILLIYINYKKKKRIENFKVLQVKEECYPLTNIFIFSIKFYYL